MGKVGRRGFLAMLAGAAAAPFLIGPHRTFFLPPKGGWISPIASFRLGEYEVRWKYIRDSGQKFGRYEKIVTDNYLPDYHGLLKNYESGIQSGHYSYDSVTDTIHMWREIGFPNDGFHSEFTGQTYDWDIVDGSGRRAAIDDGIQWPLSNGYRNQALAELKKDPYYAGPPQFKDPAYSGQYPDELPYDAELIAAQTESRRLAAERAAAIRAIRG